MFTLAFEYTLYTLSSDLYSTLLLPDIRHWRHDGLRKSRLRRSMDWTWSNKYCIMKPWTRNFNGSQLIVQNFPMTPR